jgi:hypothetical protein
MKNTQPYKAEGGNPKAEIKFRPFSFHLSSLLLISALGIQPPAFCAVSTNMTFIVETNLAIPPAESNFFSVNSNLLNASVASGGGGGGGGSFTGNASQLGTSGGTTSVIDGANATNLNIYGDTTRYSLGVHAEGTVISMLELFNSGGSIIDNFLVTGVSLDSGKITSDGGGDLTLAGSLDALSVEATNFCNFDPHSLSNSFFGYLSGNATLSGGSNTAIGDWSLNAATTALDNVAVGAQALQSNSTDQGCVAIGYQALGWDTGQFGATWNVAIGYQSMYNSRYSADDVAIGNETLKGNNNNQNVAVGYAAMENGFNGVNYCTYIGYEAGNGSSGGGTGNSNTAVGWSAMLNANASASGDAALGYGSLYSLTTGSNNTGLGYLGGYNLTTGNNSIEIGNGGLVTDSNIIRLGSNQATAYISGTLTDSNGASLTGGIAADTITTGTITTGQITVSAATASRPAVINGSQQIASGSVTSPLQFNSGGFSLLYDNSTITLNGSGQLQVAPFFVGSGNPAISADNSYYMALGAGTLSSGTPGYAIATPASGILTGSNFNVFVVGLLPGTNCTVTVMTNLVASGITVSFTGSSTSPQFASDTTHIITTTNGMPLTVSVTQTGTPKAITLNWSLGFH